MPRRLFACCAIVAAFQLHSAAAPSVEEVPLTPAVAAVAAKYGVDRLRDRARFIADIVKRLYPVADGRAFDGAELAAAQAAAERMRDGNHGTDTVPIPLGAAIWSRAVFKRTVTPDRLLAAILADPKAALVCRGLSGMDDQTLDFIGEHPALLTFLYERGAAAVGGFGDMLRIRSGALELPGGADAAPLWSAVLNTPTSDGDGAARALFGAFGGRMAYLAWAIDSAEPAVAKFALGTWIAEPAIRLQRFQLAAQLVAAGYREWNTMERPFTRPLGDLGQILMRVAVEPNGAPLAPADRQFWTEALDLGLLIDGGQGGEGSIDLAWLLDVTVHRDMYARSDRLEQFSFGQRAFAAAGAEHRGAAIDIIRSFPHRRMLLLGLERLGNRDPDLYETTLQRADALDSSDSSRRFWTYAQYQGTFALIMRMTRVGTIDSARAIELIRSLSALPLGNGGYDGALLSWFERELDGVVPPESSWDSCVLDAISGPSAADSGPVLTWEGQTYRFNPSIAERQRLDLVRRKQGGHTIDLAAAIARIAAALDDRTLTADRARTAAQELRALAEDNAARLHHPAVYLPPPGVTPPREPVDTLNAIATDLERDARAGDLRRVPRSVAALRALTDIVFGNALISIVYASEIGDPEGAALLAGNVSLRHDFGLGLRDGETRMRQAWALPRQDFRPGVPWHVTGSLINLDVALASLQLRRRPMDRVITAPMLSSIDRDAMAVNVVMLDPRRLTDASRDRIAAAVAAGRRRVESALDRPAEMLAIADELGLDGWRRRALQWTAERDRGAVIEQFALVDLFLLGRKPGDDSDVEMWGLSGLSTYGCVCTRLPSARLWRLFEGRYQLPAVAATMGDLSLAVAVALHELQLPAPLARSVMSAAMQDFIDELKPAGSGEYWGLVSEAQHLAAERVEDYISTAAAVDGPLVPEDPRASRQD
jgi:hypothetical protein